MASAGWYHDPSGQGDGRYWDGQRWGDEVNSSGATVSSPMDPAQAETPPAPGTEYVAPPAAAAAPPSAPQPARKSPVGAIVGGVAVILAVIILIVVLVNNNDDGDTEEEPPTVTLDGELPDVGQSDTTEAPAEGE